MQSHLRYLIGNYQNQISVVMWGSLLVQYFIILHERIWGLHLVFLGYSFKITIYLPVDTDCSIRYNNLIIDSLNKKCDTYIYEFIHK